MKISWLAGLLGLLILGPLSMAQEGRGYPIGSTVADFKLRNVDDRLVSLADYKAQKGVIVVFTCNHCPFSKAYEDRIEILDRKFGPLGYPVLAIMPNDPAVYTDDRAYSFPYLIDETQAVARAFGASRTPQVYVLRKAAGDRFVLAYTGAIDDNPQDAAGVQKRFVDEVVTALLAGRLTAQTDTKPIGCAIKWR